MGYRLLCVAERGPNLSGCTCYSIGATSQGFRARLNSSDAILVINLKIYFYNFGLWDIMKVFKLDNYLQDKYKMKRLENLSSKISQNQNTNQFTYSVPTGPKRKGQTAIHRKPSQKDGLLQIPSDIKNLGQFWDRSLRKYPQNLFIEDLTFTQVDQMAKRVGSWLVSRGHNIFFLYCLNSPYWTISDIATWNYGLINVPLYDTLGAEAFNHILKISQGTLIFTTKNLVQNLLDLLGKNKFNVKEVCFFDEDISKQDKAKFETLGLKVSTFKQALNHTKISPLPQKNLDSELTYAFTSGTTGIPKGVIYTHRMAISQCYAMIGHYQFKPTDVHMSYLPIAHIFERWVTWTCVFWGINIRYARHPIAEILKDFAICRPTTIPIVPRLLNKFYPILKALHEKQGNYDKIRAMFGGRLRILVTGSAPVAPAILHFFCQALGAEFREGYGQTQTTGGSFITYSGDRNYGYVGGPNSVTQFKLVDVPEMNYLTDGPEPKGEVCMRGDSVFKKYFKDAKNTEETVDADGWNHSGDIGTILPNGALKLIDRKKNIYKLQQGQYIAPQKVENVYARCKYISQTFLYGDSLKDYSVAIIHPNLDNLPQIAQSLGITDKDSKILCSNPKITQFILEQAIKQGKKDGLHGFEQAKKIRLWHEPFQVVGIVTSTMKLQRHIAKQKFKKELEELYRDS